MALGALTTCACCVTRLISKQIRVKCVLPGRVSRFPNSPWIPIDLWSGSIIFESPRWATKGCWTSSFRLQFPWVIPICARSRTSGGFGAHTAYFEAVNATNVACWHKASICAV